MELRQGPTHLSAISRLPQKTNLLGRCSQMLQLGEFILTKLEIIATCFFTRVLPKLECQGYERKYLTKTQEDLV